MKFAKTIIFNIVNMDLLFCHPEKIQFFSLILFWKDELFKLQEEKFLLKEKIHTKFYVMIISNLRKIKKNNKKNKTWMTKFCPLFVCYSQKNQQCKSKFRLSPFL